MKFKKWLALLLALILILCTTACNYSGDDDRDNETNDSASDTLSTTGPLLYRVTDTNGNVAWVFGSIHVGRESYYPLPSYVTDALEGSDALAVEFDLIAAEKNVLQLYAAQAKCQYSFGDSIKNHLPTELYEQAVAEMRNLGIYNVAYEMYMPVMWSSIIDQAKMDPDCAEYGVDRHMIEMAYDLNLPVYDIESATEQYSMLASYSEELQIMMLESSLERSQIEYQVEMNQMMDMWQTGDYDGLREYVSAIPDDMTAEEQALYREYLEKSLTNRDMGMVDFVIDAMNDGEEVFVCVGAAHVIGVNGIVDQLKTQGYTVELVK